MKAAMLTGKKKIEVVDVDKPRGNPGAAVIKVVNCGICGSDLHYWEAGAGMGGVTGLVMGHEFSGVLDDAGGAPGLKPGDRVTAYPGDPCGECVPCKSGRVNLCTGFLKRPQPGLNAPGAYAEYIAVRPDMVRKLPDRVSDASAAMIEPATVVYHVLAQSGIKKGDSLLVVGGGTIGILCAAMARMKGASYIALTEVNPDRRAKALGFGDVSEVFDARDGKLNAKIKKATGGGVDIAVDTSAAEAGINSALYALRPGGTLVMAGVSIVPQSINTLVALAKEITIMSSYTHVPPEFDAVIDMIERGALGVERFISRFVGLEGTQAAFEELHSGKSKDVKIIVRP